MTTGTVPNAGQDGQVDSQPVRLPTPGAGLLFCRGPENASWEPQENSFLVPGQRLWQQDDTGQVHSVTESASSPPVVTADYYPTASPDGRSLIILRLLRGTVGCLYYQPLAGGQPVELIHRLDFAGTAGTLAGHRLPSSLGSRFFLETRQQPRAAGRLAVLSCQCMQGLYRRLYFFFRVEVAEAETQGTGREGADRFMG